jgi:hypothetical protein
MQEKIKTNHSQGDESNQQLKKSFPEQITLWIGIAGTVITLGLTIWNTHTKTLIDKREEELKSLELKLRDRVTGVEESKERVDRYKWVFSLYPVLSGKDDKEKNFTINLIRLALTKDEAEQLFTGLQASSDTTMQAVGQNGIKSIQNEPIAILVSQMNANSSEERKSAVATLLNNYKSSSQAITLVLRMYNEDEIRNLSPSGIINGIYYLRNTDPGSWNKQQLETAKQIISRMEARIPGSQTRAALDTFRSLINKVEANH